MHRLDERDDFALLAAGSQHRADQRALDVVPAVQVRPVEPQQREPGEVADLAPESRGLDRCRVAVALRLDRLAAWMNAGRKDGLAAGGAQFHNHALSELELLRSRLRLALVKPMARALAGATEYRVRGRQHFRCECDALRTIQVDVAQAARRLAEDDPDIAVEARSVGRDELLPAIHVGLLRGARQRQWRPAPSPVRRGGIPDRAHSDPPASSGVMI
jgi:hypothetical protein